MLNSFLNFCKKFVLYIKKLCKYESILKKYIIYTPSKCIICLENIDFSVEFSYMNDFNNEHFCRHLNSKYFHEHCLNRAILSESNDEFNDITNTKIIKSYCGFRCPLCRKHMTILYLR